MIAILKYDAGNVVSVENAINKLGYETIVTDDFTQLRNAEKVIFPGVGEASSAMNYLRQKGLDNVIQNLKQPVLGICLGMQLMCNHSEEGNTSGLGIFNTNVLRFPPLDIVPHTGWNNFIALHGSLFKGISTEQDCYFVHGFYAETCKDTVATTDYILPFSAALQKDNFYATQFHPEKSATTGQQILQNFLNL